MNSGGKIGVSVAVAALALGGGAYALFGGNPAERDLRSGDAGRMVDALATLDNDKLSEESNEKLRQDAIAALKKAPLEDVLDQMRAKNLSDEKRQQLEANLQPLMMEDMQKKVDTYFAAPEDQQAAVLDAQIDEMKKFFEEMHAYREKHKDDPDFQADEAKRGQRWSAPTTQQRKEQMEKQNPDQMVRMFRYWMKIRERAQERGIEFGPRGRRGGGGGEKK